jgi:hypothetical protein
MRAADRAAKKSDAVFVFFDGMASSQSCFMAGEDDVERRVSVRLSGERPGAVEVPDG